MKGCKYEKSVADVGALWEPIKLEDIPESTQRKGGVWHEVVKDFVASGEQAAKIEAGGYAVKSIRSCVNNAVNRLGLQGEVQVVSRGKQVYLIKRVN